MDDLVGQSQLGRNGESITFTGNTDEQTVSRAKSLHIKFAAGIFHEVRRKCVDLQLTVMGGGHGTDAAVMQVIQNCNGQCSTFRRICSGSQFIE